MGDDGHLWRLVGFALLCVALCHILYWGCRKLTSEAALRAVDYIYLSLGFLSIISVLDLQQTLLELKVPRIRAQHKIDYSSYVRCIDGKVEIAIFLSPKVICAIESEGRKLLDGPYNHEDLGRLLSLVSPYVDLPVPEISVYRRLYDQVLALHNDMETQVYGRIESDKSASVRRRLAALYIICLALSIRLGRVTAEICGWRVKDKPKEANA
ncbi:hypothetical protein TM239_11330 [Bradyrhizobium sp. TM239]|nr:hypothetical protein TM239_11330 [Bradyrhizobium sp. TM239]